jgi:hypothetical protein
MLFIPFRRLSNRGALLAVIACGALTYTYYQLDESEQIRKKRAMMDNNNLDPEWKRKR